MATAFFYGTLMHPKILTRVIGNDGSHLKICPALLLNYTRHQIEHADYPGIVPYSLSHEKLFKRDLPEDERCVRGTLVWGLTDLDLEFLDVFEGSEYTREAVPVHPLSAFKPLSASPDPSTEAALVPAAPPPPAHTAIDLVHTIPAQTYVWAAPVSRLRPDVWDFAHFVAESAHKWVGGIANADYEVVEQRREALGGVVRAVGQNGVVREEF